MAVWSKVKFSKIDAKSRIDSEYFSPEFIVKDEKLGKINSKPLPVVFNVSDGNHLEISHSFTDNEDGIPYFRGKDINNFFLGNAEPIKIPYHVFNAPQMQRSHFKAKDILLSIVGTIGSVSIVPESIGLSTGSCKIAILREKGAVSPYYLAAFLLSKYGQSQIKRNTRGAVQMGLILKDLVHIKIPIFSSTEELSISNRILSAISINQESWELYIKAQKSLEQELGLDKLKFRKPVGYEANFSQAMFSSRADAEHFYPEFDSLCRHLPAHIKFTPLSKALVYCQRGKQPEYSENGIRVINSKHVLSNKINFEDNRFATIPPIDALTINHGDVLLNGTGRGTIGRAAPYLETEAALPDNHVTILRTRDIDPVYLSIFLNSEAGQLQVEKHQRGSSGQIELYPQDIRKFLIWEAPQSLQSEVRNLHDQASSLEKESKQLLEQAKQMVEDLIEQAAGGA